MCVNHRLELLKKLFVPFVSNCWFLIGNKTCTIDTFRVVNDNILHSEFFQIKLAHNYSVHKYCVLSYILLQTLCIAQVVIKIYSFVITKILKLYLTYKVVEHLNINL